MELHRLLGDPELLRDRLVRQAARDGANDHELALGQPGVACRALARVLGDADRREHLAVERLTQRGGQVVGVDRLDDVRVRAALQRRLDQLGILRDGQDRHLHVRELLADLRQAGEAVHLGHSQVEQDEVGLQPPHERQHLDAVDRLAHDLEAAGPFQGLFCAFDHQPMVIRNEYAQGLHLHGGLGDDRCGSRLDHRCRDAGRPRLLG